MASGPVREVLSGSPCPGGRLQCWPVAGGKGAEQQVSGAGRAACWAGRGGGPGARADQSQGRHPGSNNSLSGNSKRDGGPLQDAVPGLGRPGGEHGHGHGAGQRKNQDRAASNGPIRVSAKPPRQHQRRIAYGIGNA